LLYEVVCAPPPAGLVLEVVDSVPFITSRISSQDYRQISAVRSIKHKTGYFPLITSDNVRYTVIPRLTSDPANEFFG